QTWAVRLVVKFYRIVGLALLVLVVFGLVSYLALVGFYACNRSWISPQIISPTDERVLQLNDELAQGMLVREKLSSERLEQGRRLRDAKPKSKKTRQFKSAFVKSVKQTTADEAKRLRDLRNVLASYNSTAPNILSEQAQYLANLESEDETLHRTHLIDEEEYLSRKHKLSELTLSGLSLQKGTVELQQAGDT